MKLYTEEQVREMLKQQEQSISDNASVGNGTVFTKISVKWPAPIQAIPVERVKEAVNKLVKKINDLEYQIEVSKSPDYLEENLRSRLLRAKQEAVLECHVLLEIELRESLYKSLSDGK